MAWRISRSSISMSCAPEHGLCLELIDTACDRVVAAIDGIFEAGVFQGDDVVLSPRDRRVRLAHLQPALGRGTWTDAKAKRKDVGRQFLVY
jgi:hypothetical protein